MVAPVLRPTARCTWLEPGVVAAVGDSSEAALAATAAAVALAVALAWRLRLMRGSRCEDGWIELHIATQPHHCDVQEHAPPLGAVGHL